MAVKIIILIALMAGTAFAYDPVSSYSVTNNRELLNPEVSFTGQVGRLMRVTTYVKNGDTTPYDLGTNSVRAWITQADSGTNQTVTATIISASSGIVQYQWTPVLDGNNSAKLVAYAMANTTIVAQIAEHYVTVTPSAANIVSLSLNPLIDLSGTVGTPTHRWASGAFGDLSVGSLSVTGSISAIDTGAVKIVGSSMTGGLTNRSSDGFVGNGVNLTNLSGVLSVSSLAPLSNAVLQAVTNAGATINGSAISNGAAIKVSAGGETRSFYWSVGWYVNDYAGWTVSAWYPIQPTNTPACVYYVTNTYNLFNTTNFTFMCATTGQHNADVWLEEASGVGKTYVTGLYENDILITNGIGNLYNPSDTTDWMKAVHGYSGDESALTGSSFSDAPAKVIFNCSNVTNVYKLAFSQNAVGSVASLWRGRLRCYWVGTM